MTPRDRLKELFLQRAVRFGDFTLASGRPLRGVGIVGFLPRRGRRPEPGVEQRIAKVGRPGWFFTLSPCGERARRTAPRLSR